MIGINLLSPAIQRRAAKLNFFKNKVGTKKEFDIKQPHKGFSRAEIGDQAIYDGKVYNYDDFGNINYGVAARALGLTYFEAIAGAGYNQTFQTKTPDFNNPGGFFDHSRDTQMINLGFFMEVPQN
ncbi:MAG TPA: polymorphic toxin type 44 domain-containing protein [Ohtaekwangia sp.]|uniref:polymorphic toxin type 44 domain-containing protein n=1 Tax=Ohtaekwangia sp. TaxID=2066019 RepID=UPI002F92C933